MEITRVGVAGAGTMGSGIAEVAARAGVDVVLQEIAPDALERSMARIDESLRRGLEASKLSQAEADAARDRIQWTTELAELEDCQLIVEAVIEDEGVKTEVLAAIDRAAAEASVLASNTSSIPIARLAAATSRPEIVVGMHFFNPVPVLKLVEIIPSLATSQAAIDTATVFAEALGKTVVRAPDRGGFIVNALLVPFLLDAIRMYEAGVASAEDIDTAMQLGAAHPMGPLALCDLIGNDVMLLVAESLYEEFRETRHAPPPSLRRMVEGGRLGRKSGRGFYSYD